MASPKLGARLVSLLALSWLGLGCYSTTPHRVQVATATAPKQCATAIADVFARSGFVQLPTPHNWSMFFGPRLGGPYSSFLATGSGIGVTLQNEGGEAGTCHVTLEALSPDVDCPGSRSGPSGTLNCLRAGMPPDGSNGTGPSATPLCPIVPSMMCELSSAPGDDNDAAVDELARRLRAALSPTARVD
ncbi:MAG TPA: hypothetical protein VLA14_09135 [Polyangia bacterium]|jgi:hypothetical protein|nr:hypothetical protein [Polyangia bacterium]